MPKNRTMRLCAFCGREFLACCSPSDIKTGRGKYCSRQCNGFGSQSVRPPADRFWDKVVKTTTCWLWVGQRSKGYGMLNADSTGKSKIIATHVAWEIASGTPVPDGLVIGHTCDNTACVRHDEAGWYEVNGVLLPRWGHLFLGTNVQNHEDKVSKGRQAKGGHLPHTKLTDTQVAEIRARAANGERQRLLARAFGVGPSHISRILSGWRRSG